MSPEDAVGLAIEVAEVGLAKGEMPIGAVVLLGDVVVGRAHTEEIRQRRRIVHADLLAMEAADRALGLGPQREPLTLAVNLEPCLMCLGAAVTLRVDRICFGLWSPDDGGVDLMRHWKPANELAFFKPPREIVGGYGEDQIRDQFRRYAADETRPAGMREWCAGLASG
ncbi:deaminase [Promicromonospora sp. NPDC060204]|uniref:deaminase n=1 Tax=Promicromonospora sp. NPDC060204 TaxID=3347071 RepID=UPI003651F042